MPVNARWVDEIHSRLLIRYGRDWLSLYPGTDPELVKADWAHVLEGMPGYRIKHALETLPERVPNAIQFRDLCLRAPEQQEVPALRHDVKPQPERAAELMGRLTKPLHDGKEWARRLRARELACEPLTQFQRRCWREALATIGEYTEAPPQ